MRLQRRETEACSASVASTPARSAVESGEALPDPTSDEITLEEPRRRAIRREFDCDWQPVPHSGQSSRGTAGRRVAQRRVRRGSDPHIGRIVRSRFRRIEFVRRPFAGNSPAPRRPSTVPPDSRAAPRPCRRDSACSNPSFHGRLGQGAHPCRRRHFHEETAVVATGVPFVVPALRTPPHTTQLALQPPAGW